MNIDVLISKYLDGELTPEEDVILRNSLSEDKLAKADFDTDVHLHLAIKDDAKSIVAPQSLIKATEDKILMKILANQPIVDEIPSRKNYYIKFSSTVLAVLIFSIFRISDFNLSFLNEGSDFSNKIIDNNQTKEINKTNLIKSVNNTKKAKINSNLAVVSSKSADMLQNTNVASNKNETNFDDASAAILTAIPSISEGASLNATSTNITEDLKNSSNENSSTKAIDFDNIQKKSSTNQYTELMQRQNSFNEPNSNNIPVIRNGNINNPLSSFDLFNQNSEVILSSFLGNDFYGSGIIDNNIKKISNFSQSVAYSVNESNRLGVEMGYTEFTYNDKIVVNIPVGGFNSGSDVEVGNDPDPSKGGSWVLVPVNTPRNQQFYWGAAFYENVLISNNVFSLTGRLGLGATNNGPLTYGRLYLNYNIYNGIFLTIGSEGRYFMHKYYQLNNSITDWRGAASLIYGLQFKF
jgi:hypothetical protein